MTERHLYRDLTKLQDRCCGICGDNGTLVVDHDHHTGFVRGLLCAGCNNAEGRHRCDNVWSDCAVCTWRKRPAVAWLGWTERYTGIGTLCEIHLDDPWTSSAETALAARERGAGVIARLYTDEVAS